MIAAITGLLVWRFKPTISSAQQPVSRTVVTLPAGQQLDGLNWPAIALSPDGSRLAYVAIRDRVSQIYLRPMDSLEATPIPGTENGANPFFSPDGQWIGFFRGRQIAEIPSAAYLGCFGRCHHSSRATWGSGGVIVFAPTSAGGLHRFPTREVMCSRLTQFTKGETTHRWPQFCREAKSLLFAVGSGFAAGGGANLRVAGYSMSAGKQYEVAQAAHSRVTCLASWCICRRERR